MARAGGWSHRGLKELVTLQRGQQPQQTTRLALTTLFYKNREVCTGTRKYTHILRNCHIRYACLWLPNSFLHRFTHSLPHLPQLIYKRAYVFMGTNLSLSWFVVVLPTQKSWIFDSFDASVWFYGLDFGLKAKEGWLKHIRGDPVSSDMFTSSFITNHLKLTLSLIWPINRWDVYFYILEYAS